MRPLLLNMYSYGLTVLKIVDNGWIKNSQVEVFGIVTLCSVVVGYPEGLDYLPLWKRHCLAKNSDGSLFPLKIGKVGMAVTCLTCTCKVPSSNASQIIAVHTELLYGSPQSFQAYSGRKSLSWIYGIYIWHCKTDLHSV